MNDPHPSPLEDTPALRLAQLEARIARLEAHTGLAADPAPAPVTLAPPTTAATAASAASSEDELEFEVGQNWFAKVGIVVLTLGAGFTVSLPYASLPAGTPSLIGAALAAGLFGLSRWARHSFEQLSGYFRGVAMTLLYFATLRLYFFGPQPILGTDTWSGRLPLVLVVALNLVLAWRRRSPWLAGLALAMGYATALAIGAASFALPAIVLLTALAAAGALRGRWPALVLAAIPLGYATYFLWAAGNPLLGHPFHFTDHPAISPAFVLATALLLAGAALLRANRGEEDGVTNASSALNCAIGYGVFLVHTAAALGPVFTVAHLAASAVFLGIAVAFWMQERSRVSTFLYAMTGYMALSMAILKATAAPELFVWLSVQSVVVVATAIWFRSRFIVVANFLIYVMIVLGYVIVAQRETGISLGFGLVALVSARILNWQRDRLELKTELMRNSYLLVAFVVFPYALYHLVPGRHVGLAWVGLALFYYAMNLIVRNQKFRWMGHATLLLTSLYIVVVGTSSFGPVYRVLSFLALGTVMLAVSLVFTRLRKRPR